MTSAPAPGPKPMVTTRELDAWHASIRREGACAGKVSGPDDPDPWFPVESGGQSDIRRHALEEAARRACGGCPVIAECGRWAVATRQRSGVWGGMAEHEVLSAIRAASRASRRVASAEAQALACADETSTVAPAPVAPQLVEVVERGRSASMAPLCTTSAVAEVA